MIDLLLTVLPRYTTYSDPHVGVSIINACAKEAGFNSKTVDFNIMFYNKIVANSDQHMLERIDSWMEMNPDNSKGGANEKQTLSYEDRKELDQVYQDWLDTIEEHQPKYLGFSVFTQWSVKPALDFIPLIKKRFPDIKIIIGGSGTSPRNDQLYDLVDYYVEGEGEIAIVEILQGNGKTCPGVNGNQPKQMDDMNYIPYPDYSDFNMDDYICKGKMLRITGSRGCIRRCNFCDHYKTWPLFRWRRGDIIADEIFHQWSTLPAKPDMFIFTDSLLNGNMQMMRGLCIRLIELREQNPEFRPKFQSYFIAASPRFMTSDDWDLLEKAGCHCMYIGVESGSEDLRYKMNKKVTDEWLDAFVQQAYKRNINMSWCIIIAFPEETNEDYMKTIKFCEKYKWMTEKENYNIGILSSEFTLHDNLDWVINNQHGIHYDSHNHWLFNKNKTLVREQRLARLVFFQKKILEWGYTFRITALMSYMKDFSNLEQIYIDRYGIEMFGDYDLYLRYKDEIEEEYKAYAH